MNDADLLKEWLGFLGYGYGSILYCGLCKTKTLRECLVAGSVIPDPDFFLKKRLKRLFLIRVGSWMDPVFTFKSASWPAVAREKILFVFFGFAALNFSLSSNVPTNPFLLVSVFLFFMQFQCGNFSSLT